MTEHPIQEDSFDILRLLSSKDNLTQRELSNHTGFSLGKTNYLLKSLIKRGLISVKNFTDNNGKLGKVKYILTKEGFNARIHLTYHFLKRKESEFNTIQKEWNEISKNGIADSMKSEGNKYKAGRYYET
ncbi:MarR family EPS-associated transcriptional regulator [Thermoproteota archaeon]